jgi:hypothetical protein
MPGFFLVIESNAVQACRSILRYPFHHRLEIMA